MSHHHHYHHAAPSTSAKHDKLTTLITYHSSLTTCISAALLLVALVVEHTCHLSTLQLLFVYLVPYLLAGHQTLHEAAHGLIHGEPFNEHLLMAVATIGALVIGFLPGADNQYAEAVVVLLLFQVGEFFEEYAEHRSRHSIAHLMQLRPDTVRVDDRTVPAADVAVGTLITVRPGERIPLDGIITDGTTTVDTAALTGESLPRKAAVGDELLSGSVNISGVVTLRVTKPLAESTVSKMIHLVEESAQKKSRSEAFITRFARVYTPVVVVLALLIAVVPPIVAHHSPVTWLYRALMFLVVSCPCALVISVPLTFFSAIGRASRQGILIKGGTAIDALATLRTVVFDKTGTLTRGQFTVTAVHPQQTTSEELCTSEAPALCTSPKGACTSAERALLHLAAHVEHHSTHPIAEALRQSFPQAATDGCPVTDVREYPGMGVTATVGTDRVSVGNTRLMQHVGAQWTDCPHTGTIVHVAINGSYAGHVVISDVVKSDAPSTIHQLRQLGIVDTVMLTGDRQQVAQAVASELHIPHIHAQLMPADKVSIVEQLLRQPRQGTLAFVGDGINDAPVLARADVGIAMGGMGSDAAVEAADVVVMDDRPSAVASAVRLARRTVTIARQNIWAAIGIKAAVLVLAALGLSTMWMAVFADVGVTVLAVLNAMRA